MRPSADILLEMERRPPDPPTSGGRRDDIARGATRVLLGGHAAEPAGGLFPERIDVPDGWMRIYKREWSTPAVGRNQRHNLTQAF